MYCVLFVLYSVDSNIQFGLDIFNILKCVRDIIKVKYLSEVIGARWL